MDSLADPVARVLEIEGRQDEALRQLEQLERRVEQVLAEHLSALARMTPLASQAPADKVA